MALRNIVTEGDPALRKVCRQVEKFDARLATLLDDLADTMYNAEGVGLAAPQVGILRRAVVIDIGEGKLELVNPEIIISEGEQVGGEGCLSFPGQFCTVKRPMKVCVRAQNRDGEWFETEGEGLLARAFCHEIDHLNGVVFKDLAEDEPEEDMEEAE